MPRSFFENDFNISSIRHLLPLNKQCLPYILDHVLLSNSENPSHETYDAITKESRITWCLVHRLFASTEQGISQILTKFLNRSFGVCPRAGCGRRPVLPCATTDVPGVRGLKGYCIYCNDLYNINSPPLSSVDGICFGTSIAHIITLKYPKLLSSFESHNEYVLTETIDMERQVNKETFTFCKLEYSDGTSSDDQLITIFLNKKTKDFNNKVESLIREINAIDLTDKANNQQLSNSDSSPSMLSAGFSNTYSSSSTESFDSDDDFSLPNSLNYNYFQYPNPRITRSYSIYVPRYSQLRFGYNCHYFKQKHWLRCKSNVVSVKYLSSSEEEN